MTSENCRFSFVNTWDRYSMPDSEEGKRCWLRFLNRPNVITYRGN